MESEEELEGEGGGVKRTKGGREGGRGKSRNRWSKATTAAAQRMHLFFPSLLPPSLPPFVLRYLDGGVDGGSFRVSPKVSASAVNFRQFPVTAHKRFRAHGFVGLRDSLEGDKEGGRKGKGGEVMIIAGGNII